MKRDLSRVLLVTNIFPPAIGGPATFIDRLAHRLASEGVKATVVCSSQRVADPGDVERPFRVIRVPTGNRLVYEARLRASLVSQMSVHRHILVNGLEWPAHQCAVLTRRKYVLKIVGDTVWETARNQGLTQLSFDDFQRDPEGQRAWKRQVCRRNAPFKQAHVVVTPSDFLRKVVIGWGVRPERTRTILNGVNANELSPSEPRPRGKQEDLQVLFVGRLTNWKGLETLLLAVQRTERVRVTVLGAGPAGPLLVALSKQLGLQGVVSFEGVRGRSDVRDRMQRSHVLVLTSLYEGLSHTLLEASAAGLPQIASYCGGNSEAVLDGQTGLLIPPQDVASLHNALVRLRDDEELRYRLACGALSLGKRFDMGRTVEQFSGLLREFNGPKWSRSARS